MSDNERSRECDDCGAVVDKDNYCSRHQRCAECCPNCDAQAGEYFCEDCRVTSHEPHDHTDDSVEPLVPFRDGP